MEENKVEFKEVVNIQNNVPVENPQIENQESFQDRNWRQFREQKEIERKQRLEAEKIAVQKAAETEALKAALEAVINKPSQIHNQDEEVSEDEKINRKVEALLNAREKAYEEKMRQKEHEEFPQKLAQTFQDFEKICTTENLDYLQYHYPEVAEPYKDMPDGYNKWASIYKAVKRFVPNIDSKKDQAKAEKNLSKPQSMTSPGSTATGDHSPNILDDQRKKANYSRMQKVMKGLA